MNLAINTLKTALDKHHVTSIGHSPEQAQANLNAELAQCPIFVRTLSQLRSSNSPTAKTFFDHSTAQSHHLAECPVRTHERDSTGEFHDGLDDVADGEAGIHHIVKVLGASWAKHHTGDGSDADAHVGGESPTSKATGFDVSQISSMVGMTEGLWKKFKRRGKQDDSGDGKDKKHEWEEDHDQDVEKAGGHWQGSHDKDVEMGRDMSSPSKLTQSAYGMAQLEKYITWCSQGGEVPV